MSDKHIIRTEWNGNMAFEADINGHKVTMDAFPEAGAT